MASRSKTVIFAMVIINSGILSSLKHDDVQYFYLVSFSNAAKVQAVQCPLRARLVWIGVCMLLGQDILVKDVIKMVPVATASLKII